MVVRGLIPFVLSFFAFACAPSSSGGAGAGAATPYEGSVHPIPGLIEAEHYDEGGPGEAYVDSDEVNHGAAYRGDTQVDIEQRPDASNGYGIGWVRAGEWLQYTVVVEEAGTYTLEFPVASQKRGGVFHLEMNGEDVTGPIQIPDTGAWTKLETIRKENVRLRAGAFTMRMVMDTDGESGGIGDIDYVRFVRVR